MTSEDTEKEKAFARFYQDSVYELLKSWDSGDRSLFEKNLRSCSNEFRKAKKKLPINESSLDYVAGKFSGMLESFIKLFQLEEEKAAIDDVIKEKLLTGYKSSKRIMGILYQSYLSDTWITHAALSKQGRISISALSNMMKKFISVHAVEFFKEGRTVSYRLSPAGVRFCRKAGLSEEDQKISTEDLIDIVNVMNDKINELCDIINTQNAQIRDLSAQVSSLEAERAVHSFYDYPSNMDLSDLFNDCQVSKSSGNQTTETVSMRADESYDDAQNKMSDHSTISNYNTGELVCA